VSASSASQDGSFGPYRAEVHLIIPAFGYEKRKCKRLSEISVSARRCKGPLWDGVPKAGYDYSYLNFALRFDTTAIAAELLATPVAALACVARYRKREQTMPTYVQEFPKTGYDFSTFSQKPNPLSLTDRSYFVSQIQPQDTLHRVLKLRDTADAKESRRVWAKRLWSGRMHALEGYGSRTQIMEKVRATHHRRTQRATNTGPCAHVLGQCEH
jgi:hypothetical protein